MRLRCGNIVVTLYAPGACLVTLYAAPGAEHYQPTRQSACGCNLVLILWLDCQEPQDEAGILADLCEAAGHMTTATLG